MSTVTMITLLHNSERFTPTPETQDLFLRNTLQCSTGTATNNFSLWLISYLDVATTSSVIQKAL